MNLFFTNLAEKTIEWSFYITKVRTTPNPFQPLTADDAVWQSASPADFYAVPGNPPQLDFCKDCLTTGALHDRFRFPSLYNSPFPENNIVHGLANLRREGQARGALVIVHGHAMTLTTFKLLEWYARPAIEMGLDVYLMTLPYHMQRAPHGTWSGQYSLNANIRESALAFKQGVQDIRALMSWIEQERRAPIILAGVSLGAYTACMTAVVDDRPKAVISILGGGSLAQIIWDGYQMDRSKYQLQAGGITQDQLESSWVLLGPANWQPKISKDRVLLLAGKYDPTVTPANVDRLWQAWKNPEIHWYSCGHGSIILYHNEVAQAIFNFLADRI